MAKKKASGQVRVLEQSFAALAPRAGELTARFYERLFREHPELRPMFARVTPAEQQRKLAAALAAVVANLRKPAALAGVLRELGARHERYGAQAAHYPVVASVLLATMRELAGPAWTPTVERAWSGALKQIATVMLAAYVRRGEASMATKKGKAKAGANTAGAERLAQLENVVERAHTPLMMIDRNLVITYVNQATKDLLRKHEVALRSLFSGFSVEAIVGTCIDTFHKNPSHQRGILADPARCPFETDIQVGPLRFHIIVNVLRDANGTHVGNTLEWSDVTDLRAKEESVARLQAAVEGATTPLMMIDRSLQVLYANAATYALLRRNEAALASLFPGFAVDRLIGTCIDIFHKHPEHQRRILADPSRLPHRADIKVGPLTFAITAGAILDGAGKLIGNTLEWSDVTSQRAAQRGVEQLVSDASQGDLSERLETGSLEGFLKDLGTSLNTLLDVITGPLGAIRAATDSISESSGQIKQGNADLNRRTQQSAAAIEECAASVEELTGTVKQNAENSQQARQLAMGARELAEKGGEVVGAAVGAMAEISKSSKKISDIIGVIDEIAFQTNLLALNAAVEAARAGEQGRGFAVVASEVRNLAQRSAAAAKEIKALIKDSVENVDEGSRLVDKSGATLSEIVSAVKKSSDIIAEIAAASEEQANGVEQVNKAVMQLDETTQQNAALVEEAAAASESMESQADELRRRLAFFKLGATSDAGDAPKPAAAPARPAPKSEGAKPAPARPAAAKAAAAPAPRAAKSEEGDWQEF